jgi:cell division protein FtsZ
MKNEHTRIKVVGVGGGGCRIAELIAQENLYGVDVIAVDTYAPALNKLTIQRQVLMDREISYQDTLYEALDHTEQIVLVAGMGGGTGPSKLLEVVQVTKELGIPTSALVTRPFTFEGPEREAIAKRSIRKLKTLVDPLIVLPNDRLTPFLPPQPVVEDVFLLADRSAAWHVMTRVMQI